MSASAPFVVIVGCGRLGVWLAARLDREGCAVRIIDQDPSALASLPENRAVCIAGDPLELEVLQRAGIEKADIVIGVTAKDDLNVALALTCGKVFHTQRAIARVHDPERAASFGRYGIDTVCPTSLVASELVPRIRGIADMKSLYVVVVGCGRLGGHLANLLSRDGHRVVVIDRDEASFSRLSAEFYSGFRVEGDASEPSVLRRAGIEKADLMIAATHDDNVNLMVALVAHRVFGVKHAMARVYDPDREETYRELGVETVCPTLIAGEAFFSLVYRAVEDGSARP